MSVIECYVDGVREAPLFFSKDERIALTHASLFAERAGYPYSSHLRAALQKIDMHMNQEQLDNLELHKTGFEVINVGSDTFGRSAARTAGEESANESNLEGVLRLVEGTVAENQRIIIEYSKVSADPPESRAVDPYGLIFWRENWYLVGYCHVRTTIRMFRCDRIRSVEVLNDHFDRPEGFSARGFLLESMYPVNTASENATVRLRGKPWAIDHFAQHWLARHYVKSKTANELILGIDKDYAVSQLADPLMVYGAELRVIEPKRLADVIVTIAREILNQYGEPSGELR